jgi:hypothetical protein
MPITPIRLHGVFSCGIFYEAASSEIDLLWVPPSLLSKGVPVVKSPGREADHSPPTSAEVKKMWIYTTTPPYVFMAQG